MKKIILLSLSLLFVACSSNNEEEENKLSVTSYTLRCGESIVIDGDKELKIENPFVALFSNGEIKGFHIGKTDAVYNGSQKIDITVNGTVNYLEYPVMEWGISASEVKSKHKGGGTLQKESTDQLMYQINYGSKAKYFYFYSISNNKLEAAGLMVPYTETSKVVEWLSERFILIPTSDNTFITGGFDGLTTETAKTAVAVQLEKTSTSTYVSSYAYMIVFMPSSSTKSSNPEIKIMPVDETGEYHEMFKEVGIFE